MPDRAFLDTNVVIYALTEGDPAKKHRARSLLSNLDSSISTQVLLEATNVLTKKLRIDASQAARLLRGIMDRPVVQQTPELVEEAWRISSRYQLGIYDAAIVASAQAARCTLLYTEDLQNGQRIERLTIRNPFLS